MESQDSSDRIYHDKELRRLEQELAALCRQFGRAIDGGDQIAVALESEAICDKIRNALYHHLDLRVGMSSDDWVWVNSGGGDANVERPNQFSLHVSGRYYCSLAGGHHQWTEPFRAMIHHNQERDELSEYSIWFGNRATLLNMRKVREVIEAGHLFHLREPENEHQWAYRLWASANESRGFTNRNHSLPKSKV